MTDRINKLFAYLDDMTPEQLEERVKQIRTERRTVKKSAAKVRKTAVKSIDNIKTIAKGLSDEDIEALIKRLEDGN